MGATGERARRSEGGQRGTKHIVFRVPTTSKGAMGSKGVRICYTRFLGPHHLCGARGERARRSEREQRGGGKEE